MPRAACWAVVFGLVACSGRTQFVALPAVEGARSLLLAVSNPMGTSVTAYDLGSDLEAIELRPRAARDLPTEVEAVFYAKPLSELKLSPGAITEQGTGKLPKASLALFGFQLAHLGDRPALEPRVTPSDRLAAFRFPAALDLCAAFTVETSVLLPTNQEGWEVRAIDDCTVLLITETNFAESALLYAIDFCQPAPQALTVATSTGFSTLSSARAADGEWWFGGLGGSLWSAQVRGARIDARPRATDPSALAIGRLVAGTGRSGGTEVFSLSVFGQVDHFEGEAWTPLYTYQPDPNMTYDQLTLIAPGEAVAVTAAGTPLAVRMKDGQAHEEPVPTQAVLTAIGVTPLGTVLGNIDGEFFTDKSGTWQPLPGTAPYSRPRVVLPYEDGFLYGGEFAPIAQYKPGVGYCAQDSLNVGGIHVHTMTRLGDKFVAFGSNPDPASDETHVFLLARTSTAG